MILPPPKTAAINAYTKCSLRRSLNVSFNWQTEIETMIRPVNIDPTTLMKTTYNDFCFPKFSRKDYIRTFQIQFEKFKLHSFWCSIWSYFAKLCNETLCIITTRIKHIFLTKIKHSTNYRQLTQTFIITYATNRTTLYKRL